MHFSHSDSEDRHFICLFLFESTKSKGQLKHYFVLCRCAAIDFELTCRKSNKLSATSVSLAQSEENNTTRCSCRRQEIT